MEKFLKIYGNSFKNMGGFYIGYLYWIIQRNTGRKNGIKVRCCTEGARKSVWLHNIGSMCVTALPTQISLLKLDGLGNSRNYCTCQMFLVVFSQENTVYWGKPRLPRG